MQGAGLGILRLALSVVFVTHGLPKLVPVWGSSPAATAALFEAVGLVPGLPLSLAIGAVEVAGGVLLLAGLYTGWACLALLLDMAIVIWTVHLRAGFFDNWNVDPGGGHGFEHAMVLVAALVCLMVAGAGAYSIDERRARSAEAAALGRARLRRSGKV